MRERDPRFVLDPRVVPLNHGSFGALPVVVRDARDRHRAAAEANPTRFHRRVRPGLVARARAEAGRFLEVADDGLVLVRNATEGIAVALAAVPLGPGEEILLSDHGYGAVAIAARAHAERVGARVRTVSFPLSADEDAVVAAFAGGLGPATRLVVVDAITSATALCLPVARVAALCRERGVPVAVDAAHVPGHLPQRPDTLGADFWVGNFHKWAWAAWATAGLWIAPRWRGAAQPAVRSWGHAAGFPVSFDDAGTADYSPWLSLPEALAFWAECGGWSGVARSAALLDEGVRFVADHLGAAGQAGAHHPPLMRLVETSLPGPAHARYDELSDAGVEVSVVEWEGRVHLRLSAQVYNTPADFRALVAAL